MIIFFYKQIKIICLALMIFLNKYENNSNLSDKFPFSLSLKDNWIKFLLNILKQPIKKNFIDFPRKGI